MLTDKKGSSVTLVISEKGRRFKGSGVSLAGTLLVALMLSQVLALTSIYAWSASATNPRPLQVGRSDGPFSFAAVGDYNFSRLTAANWRSMSSSGADFVLGLGDFLYHRPPPTEQSWCNEFKGNITNVELITGNHETLESNMSDWGGGSINKFLQYCPFTLGTLGGTYGLQYYFDYPTTNPLVRYIMIDPAIWLVSSTAVSYDNNTNAQQWVGTQIDTARAAGIRWIIVGMHKVCISAGVMTCEIGQDLMRFLISKKVDLVLQGHEHNYQRSKQLTCATINAYDPTCVANDGQSGSYVKGAGTIFLIDGTGGAVPFDIIRTDHEYPYFAKTNTGTFGYTKYSVTQTSISAQFVNTTGTFQDTWSIDTPGSQSFKMNVAPSQLTIYQKGTEDWPQTNVSITLTSHGGLTGLASFTAKISGGYDPSPTITFTHQTIMLPPNGQASTILAINAPRILGGWLWTININSTVGGLSQAATITATFLQSYFTIQAPSNTPIIFPGSSITEDIQLQSHNNLTDTITLHSFLTPDLARYVTVSLTPSTITLPSNSTQSVRVHVSISSNALGSFGCKCSLPLEADGNWWKAYGSLPIDVPTHTYPPGVQPGIWATYNVTRNDAVTKTVKATIIQVNGSNVTFTVDTYHGDVFINSTKTWTDLVTGENPKVIIPFFLIAGNLTEGLPIYETDPFQSIGIRLISTEPLAGTLRPTIGAQTVTAQSGANIWWDNYTGMLARYDTSTLVNNQPIRIHYELVATNAWSKLTATITTSTTTGTVPATIVFSPQVSGGTPPYEFSWNFGDNEVATIENPSHTYTKIGNYTVTLRVVDALGNFEQKTINIMVSRSFVPGFPQTIFARPENPRFLAIMIIAALAVVATATILQVRSKRHKQT